LRPAGLLRHVRATRPPRRAACSSSWQSSLPWHHANGKSLCEAWRDSAMYRRKYGAVPE
jgi:hypothetical protein